jgi:N-acetylglucosamine-6-phosphate deacetylase
MARRAGCALGDAVRMASLAPARALGLAGHKGRLVAGYDADAVVLDRDLAVRATVVAGEVVYRA